jgi:uncharacterized cysteine cluster protein YcgN (CxxCxxCC family)
MKGECLQETNKNSHKVSWLSSNICNYAKVTQNRVNREYAVRHVLRFSHWYKEIPGVVLLALL